MRRRRCASDKRYSSSLAPARIPADESGHLESTFQANARALQANVPRNELASNSSWSLSSSDAWESASESSESLSSLRLGRSANSMVLLCNKDPADCASSGLSLCAASLVAQPSFGVPFGGAKETHPWLCDDHATCGDTCIVGPLLSVRRPEV